MNACNVYFPALFEEEQLEAATKQLKPAAELETADVQLGASCSIQALVLLV